MQVVQLIVRLLSALGGAQPRAADVGGRLVRNASEMRRSQDCAPIILPIGYNKVKLTPVPIGRCKACCPINMIADVRVLLFNKDNPSHGIQLVMRRGSMKRAGLDPRLRTVIYIHGFVEDCSSKSSSYAIRDAYLARPEPYNVILVDWSNLSAGPWYGEAAENTIIVAAQLARLLRFFHKTGEISMHRVHLIGFSLGAQIAGMTGKHLRKTRLINRITGLDPALPLYPIEDVAHRITEHDAEFVDVIHTTTVLLGYPVSIGHTDFYVNPEKDFQPGCSFGELVDTNKIDDFFSCSHQRAWNLYVDTVRNAFAYAGTKCGEHEKEYNAPNNVFMGFNVSRKSQGDYCVTTA